jgi:hypothetical protein
MMTRAIDMVRIGNGNTFIPAESLSRLRSVIAEHEAPIASDKYRFLSTLNVIRTLSRQQWYPVVAQEQRVKTVDRQGFQKHMIRFRQPGTQLSQVGDLAPELILTNAHDTTAAYIIMAGFFRLACLNGLIVSEAEFGAIHIRHVGCTEKEVLDATAKLTYDIPRLVERVGAYRSITLSTDERFAFAESALIMKFATKESDVTSRPNGLIQIDKRTFSPQDLLTPVRQSDAGISLWNTYNVVQEKITKGNKYERTLRITPQGSPIHQTKVRGITGIDENIRINRDLWHLMERMRELKS